MSVDGRGDNEPSPAEVSRARWHRWTRALLIVMVASVVAVVVSTVLPSSASRGPAPAWREDLSWVLIVVALVLIVAGVVLAVRARTYRDRHAAQMSMFSRDQRRRGARCVRRGQPAPQEINAVAVLSAQALVRQRTMVLLYTGIAANTLAIALNSTNLGVAAVEAAAVVVMLVVVVVTLVQAHGARRWLQTYAPTSSEQNVA